MGVVIKIGGRKAFLREGKWWCADRRLELRLNEETDRWIGETGGPELNSLDPEADVARTISRVCGGSVILQAQARPKRSAALYLARRQYSFDF